MLDCKNVTVEFSSGGYAVRPLDGFSMDAGPGDLVLLLGASGCGKTTMLSVLAAILKPTSGSVLVDDTEVTHLDGRGLTDYRRDQVGIVFQSFNLLPSLTALENVAIPLRASGMSKRDARTRAAELLDRLNLSDRSHHRPGDLSGGQQQRVAIARAIALDPPVLLADEPTAHLDYIQVEGVLKLLRELADEGRTVIVSTHDERLIPLADKVIGMSPAAAGESGPAREVHLSPGEVLFAQGDPGDRVYVIEEGSVEIIRERDDGSEERLTLLEAPHYFGELAPMLGLRRSATARAVTHTKVTGMSPTEFRERFSDTTLSQLFATPG
ncbi:MAG: putative transport system ATP-binding protein [Solirubrobacteraceae bacterium]|nr:putative transport system ATP-binding protein [Solirubrobacteraceae bacterium]